MSPTPPPPPPAPALEARHVYISGRVQGVAFRHHMVQEGRRLGLTGWVRNKPDGRVEALFQGPAADVAALLAWAQQGSPMAQVEQLLVEQPMPAELAELAKLQGFAQHADG